MCELNFPHLLSLSCAANTACCRGGESKQHSAVEDQLSDNLFVYKNSRRALMIGLVFRHHLLNSPVMCLRISKADGK